MADEEKTERPADPDEQKKAPVSESEAPIKKRVVKRKAVKKKSVKKKVAKKRAVTKKKITVQKKVVAKAPVVVNTNGASSPAEGESDIAERVTATPRISPDPESPVSRDQAEQEPGGSIDKPKEKSEETAIMASDTPSTGMSATPGKGTIGFWPKVILSLIIILASFMYIRSLARNGDLGVDNGTGAVEQQSTTSGKAVTPANLITESRETPLDQTGELTTVLAPAVVEEVAEIVITEQKPAREAESSVASTVADQAVSVDATDQPGGTEVATTPVQESGPDKVVAVQEEAVAQTGSEVVVPESSSQGQKVAPPAAEKVAADMVEQPAEVAVATSPEADAAARDSRSSIMGSPESTMTDSSPAAAAQAIPAEAPAAPLAGGTGAAAALQQGGEQPEPGKQTVTTAEGQQKRAARPERSSGGSGRPSFKELFGYERPTPATRSSRFRGRDYQRPGFRGERYAPYPYGRDGYRGRGGYPRSPMQEEAYPSGQQELGRGYQGGPLYPRYRGYPGYGGAYGGPYPQESFDRYPSPYGYGPYNY